jgi:hypothetical protein
MRDTLPEQLAVGTTGRFWAVVDGIPRTPEMHSSIRRNDEGFWVAEIEGRLTADGGSEDEQTFPDSMVGVARGGTFYLSDRRRWKDLRPGMGQSLHIVQLFYETIVTRVDLNSVEADGIVEAEVIFPNQYVWARYERPEWRRRSADDPLGKGVSLDFAPVEETKVDLHDGFTLTVKPTWWSDWDIEQLTIGAGLSLALSSADPVPTARYVRDFEQMQDLIGLCWSGRVIPLPGAGRVNHSVEDAGTFFSQPFFDPHHGNLADLSTPFPAIYLPDLGGPPAFARWLELCRDYRRATRGVSEGLYVGASAETRLLNTVTAISDWVGSHRRTPAWTAVKHRNKEDDVRLLVDHMLPRFESWFGDGGQFSARLWWDYNQLKHDPGHAIDYTLVSVFTSAARLLLIGDLLDTVAGTTKPSKRIADHYWQLRDGVQEILQDPERCRVTDARHKRHKRRHRSGASRPAPKGDT